MKTTKKLSNEEVVNRLFTKGYHIISDYKNTKEYIIVSDFEGYRFKTNVSTIMRSNPDKFHISNPYTTDNIKLWLKLNNSVYSLLSINYTGNSDDLLFLCPTHGEFASSWNKISNGSGCGYCGGKKVHFIDSVFSKRKDLLVYFENEEDAKHILCGSDKIVKLICPKCKTPKDMKMNTLNNSGFSCSKCSDGISIPEKFVTNILEQLKVSFIRQYSTSWSNNKRYDFLIELKDSNGIIETHGEQHYKGWGGKIDSLKIQIDLDEYKYKLAIDNGIKPVDYIVIDCRESTLNWLKENCIKELSNHFDLSNINWKTVWDCCITSYMVDICNDWNNKTENQTTTFLCEKYKIDRTTVISYLKKGTELGLCVYDSEHEKDKNNSGKNRKVKTKPIIQYDLNMNYITEYTSAIEASKKLNIDNSSICKCCIGKRRSVGGYIWKYK